MTNHLPTERRLQVRARAEHGAALILVAILIFVLVGGTAFVLDYGVMWVARRQAQNAADAGALAGAVARAFDDTAATPAEGGRAWSSAMEAATANNVWNEPPVFELPDDGWTCPGFVTPAGRCVTVNVYRDSDHGNPLPIYFGALFGRTSQKVRATATAEAIPANATNCLRPWAVPDRWWWPRNSPDPSNPLNGEHTDPPDEFNAYYTSGPNQGGLLPNPDTYVQGNTGYQLPLDRGTGPITLHMAKDTSDPSTSAWYRSLDLLGASGAKTYQQTIESCVGSPTRIGQYVSLEPGVMSGPNSKGIQNLINQDPAATWVTDENGGHIAGGCMAAANPCTLSPRVVVIAVYDPADYAARSATHNKTVCAGGALQCVKVVNLLGFFVSSGDANGNVEGYIWTKSGDYDDTAGQWVVTNPAFSFLWDIRLVR